jgi:DNA mismatch endonuclease Vsr
MADTLTPEQRVKAMCSVKSRDTSVEMAVRSLVHAMGFRYRLHVSDLPGKPDLVFPSRRKIIQVHGCFWHQHLGCRHATMPSTNAEYWVHKLYSNVRRDNANVKALKAMGWKVMVVWECEAQARARQRLIKRLRRFLCP